VWVYINATRGYERDIEQASRTSRRSKPALKLIS
jgi:hypothetical protein